LSDRLVRFPGSSWQEIEALPEPLRWAVQRAVFQLLDEPVPTLADPFPVDASLPGAYELYLPADGAGKGIEPSDQHETERAGDRDRTGMISLEDRFVAWRLACLDADPGHRGGVLVSDRT
jgi:hypothetical protein